MIMSLVTHQIWKYIEEVECQNFQCTFRKLSKYNWRWLLNIYLYSATRLMEILTSQMYLEHRKSTFLRMQVLYRRIYNSPVLVLRQMKVIPKDELMKITVITLVIVITYLLSKFQHLFWRKSEKVVSLVKI